MSVSKSVLFVSIGFVAVAAAGGVAWKALGASGPRGVVVEAQRAAAQLELSRLRSLMSSVAQRRVESQMFDSLNDARFKKSFAKFVGESSDAVDRWDAWQMLDAMVKHRERLTVAGMDIVKLLDIAQAVFGTAEVGKEAVDGDRASVPIKFAMPTEAKSGFVDLVREDGLWKLHYLRWEGETPLWEPDEDSPAVRQRKAEARSEAKTVLKNIISEQRDFEERAGHYAVDFKELGFGPLPGNRYTYFLANTGVVFRRDSAAERTAGDDPVEALKYVYGKNASAAVPKGTVIVGFDHDRFSGQVDLKSFTETQCPLTLKAATGDALPGPGVHRQGNESVLVAAAAAKLDSGPGFDCWSIASVDRVTAAAEVVHAGQPFRETVGEPYVAPVTATAGHADERPRDDVKNQGGHQQAPVGVAKAGPRATTNFGHVALGTVEVESAETDRQSLAAELSRQALAQVDDCYEVALGGNRSLKGKVVLRFTVKPGGKLTEVEAEENTVGNEGLTACARRVVAGTRIKGAFSEEVPVAAAFVFTPN